MQIALKALRDDGHRASVGRAGCEVIGLPILRVKAPCKGACAYVVAASCVVGQADKEVAGKGHRLQRGGCGVKVAREVDAQQLGARFSLNHAYRALDACVSQEPRVTLGASFGIGRQVVGREAREPVLFSWIDLKRLFEGKLSGGHKGAVCAGGRRRQRGKCHVDGLVAVTREHKLFSLLCQQLRFANLRGAIVVLNLPLLVVREGAKGRGYRGYQRCRRGGQAERALALAIAQVVEPAPYERCHKAQALDVELTTVCSLQVGGKGLGGDSNNSVTLYVPALEQQRREALFGLALHEHQSDAVAPVVGGKGEDLLLYPGAAWGVATADDKEEARMPERVGDLVGQRA